MAVETLPEFVALFKKTRFICVCQIFEYLMYLGEKSKSHVLIKRYLKRSRDEFEESYNKLEKQVWNQEKEQMIMQIENLKQKIDHFEQMEEAYLVDREKLCTLFDKGIIDESGMSIQNREDQKWDNGYKISIDSLSIVEQ